MADIIETIGRGDPEDWVTCAVCDWGDPVDQYIFGVCGGCMLGLLVDRGILELQAGAVGIGESAQVKPAYHSRTSETDLPRRARLMPRFAQAPARAQAYAPTYEPANHPDHPEWTASRHTKADGGSWWRKYPMADGGEVMAIIQCWGANFYAQLRGAGGAQERLGKRASMGGAISQIESALDYDPQLGAALDDADDLPW